MPCTICFVRNGDTYVNVGGWALDGKPFDLQGIELVAEFIEHPGKRTWPIGR